MAVTIGELFDAARDHLEAVRTRGVDTNAAANVAAGLAPISRALDLIYGYRPYAQWEDETRPADATVLAATLADAASGWPHRTGRIPDLLGSAADAIGTHARALTPDQRWALTEALASTARRCIDTAREFPPYAHIPQLRAARDAAVACEHRATRHPVQAADLTALDRLVPGRHLTASPAERITDAAAALHAAITGRGPHPRLCMAEMLITVNAGHLATAHAAALLTTRTAPDRGAPQAWRAARAECAGFDDGTKLRPPHAAPVASAAARLGRNLLDQLGGPTRHACALAHHQIEPDTLAALHTVTALLPDIATALGHALHGWVAEQTLWAPERHLLGYEERNAAVISIDRFGPAEARDLRGLDRALDLAASLTAALTVDLGAQLSRDQAVGVRQPNLVQKHAAATDANQYLSVQATSAHDAVRHAHALHPQEWAFPTAPRQARIPR